jgi:hypothetical protein
MYVVKLTGLIILFKNNLLQDAIEKLLRFIWKAPLFLCEYVKENVSSTPFAISNERNKTKSHSQSISSFALIGYPIKYDNLIRYLSTWNLGALHRLISQAQSCLRVFTNGVEQCPAKYEYLGHDYRCPCVWNGFDFSIYFSVK